MHSTRSAAYWKEKLSLTSHVEGGAFREIYRSRIILSREDIGKQFQGDRNASTSIYFLLQSGEFSAFHRIASDELWHFYDGGTLSIYEIRDGKLYRHLLGLDIDAGAHPQVVIPAGSWFASVVEAEDSYTLCGCTVAPGFDFQDFELASRQKLTALYPQHANIITKLTY